MDRSPISPFYDFHDLLERSDRLIWQSDQADIASQRLSRHLAHLNADSDQLIEHCRRLGERLPGGRRKKADQD